MSGADRPAAKSKWTITFREAATRRPLARSYMSDSSTNDERPSEVAPTEISTDSP